MLCAKGGHVTAKEILLHEIEGVPDSLVAEVIDFVRFLKTQRNLERLETALLSESALRKDWLRPEEDEAWRDL
jgi:hypothetical protein